MGRNTYPNTVPATAAAPTLTNEGNAPLTNDRAKVVVVAGQQIGVREKTGNNDGVEVEAYLASTGTAKGNPYCAAFVYWCGKTALGVHNPYPRSAWSPDMVAGGSADIASARPADTFGIYNTDKGRIAHTGIVERVDGKFLITLEANTSATAALGSAADREASVGGGVYRKRRPLSTVKRVKSWFP